MKFIKLYCLLFLLSVLLLQPVWSSEKYILPLIPFFLIFLARGMVVKLNKNLPCCDSKFHGKRYFLKRWKTLTSSIILLAFLTLNAIYIGEQSFRQITNNIDYLKGDRYAGYPPEVRQYFEQLERLRGLPDSTVVVARKPEFVYIISGKKAIYPWQMEE